MEPLVCTGRAFDCGELRYQKWNASYETHLTKYYFQSKSKGTSMASFDLLGSGKNQLIVGWESGRVRASDNLTFYLK